MRRLLWTVIILLAAVAGGTVVYFLVTIPRDIRADKLLRQAHADVTSKRPAEARAKLRELVRTYPRTDAGAAAAATLLDMLDQDRRTQEKRIDALARQNDALATQIRALAQQPATQPPAVAPPLPAPEKTTVRKAAPRPAHRAHRTRARRRRRR